MSTRRRLDPVDVTTAMRDLPAPPPRAATPRPPRSQRSESASHSRVTPDQSPSDTEPAAAGETNDSAAPRRRSRAKKQVSSQSAVATTVLVPVGLLDGVRTTARHENSTITALVLRIITNELDHLADLVTAEKPASTATGPFPDDAGRPPSEPKSQLFLRLTPANAQALDDLVTTAGATSRSQLITAALRGARLETPQTR